VQREFCGEKERAHPAHDDGQRVARHRNDEQQVSILNHENQRSRLRLKRDANVSVW